MVATTRPNQDHHLVLLNYRNHKTLIISGFGPSFVYQTPSKLVDVINLVEVGGGNECPENSMPAIERALTISKPNSIIFVFTDGYASNNNKLNSVENLCRTTNSQVIFTFRCGSIQC